MSSQFLTLCRDLVGELGVAGGSGPAATAGQVGELRNIVRWVAEADLYVQNLWIDWDFLWTKATGNPLAAESDSITSITDMENEVKDGLILHAGTARAYRPQWMSWPIFRQRYDMVPQQASASPAAWSVRPDKTIVLSGPVLAETSWTLEYYRRPVKLSANTDLSLIPERFERIILARAAIMYGVREDAPEIVQGFSAEYADTLEKMEAFYLPAFKAHRASQKSETDPDILGRG